MVNLLGFESLAFALDACNHIRKCYILRLSDDVSGKDHVKRSLSKLTLRLKCIARFCFDSYQLAELVHIKAITK